MNPFRGLRAVFYKESLHIRRDPRTVIFALLIPVMQMIFLGFAIDTNVRQVPTVVLDESNTQASRDLLDRFRTAVKDVRDTAFLFFAIVVGMGAGTGFYLHTVVFTLVASLVMILLFVFKFAERKINEEVLKVTVERDSEARDLVEAYLKKYFDEHRLINNVRLFEDNTETMIYVVRARRGLDPRVIGDGLAKIAGVRGSAFYLGDQQVML